MNFDNIISQIIEQHPEFNEFELKEICEEYISHFPKKTKEETKYKSLKKYFQKEFNVDFETSSTNDEKQTSKPKFKPFESIPKSFFWTSKNDNNFYIITINNLCKQLWETLLFDDANMNFKNWEKISLIGKNGAGKSTLLKMIVGKEEIDSGEIIINKKYSIWYLSQDLFWDSQEKIVKEEMLDTLPDITKNMNRLEELNNLIDNNDKNILFLSEERNNLIEWMKNNNAYQKYSLQVDILKYFWFTEEQLNFQIKNLSWWEQTRIQIAKFLLQEVDILILDEPTNHLDIKWILFLEKFCKLRSKTLICISHDKRFLNNVFDKTIEISNHKLNKYHGNYDFYIKQKEKDFEIQQKNYINQQKYLKQQEQFIERFRYKSSKASQVQSRIKLLDKMEIIEEPENTTQVHSIKVDIKKRLPNYLIECEWLDIWYKDKKLLSCPRKLEITKDMKIGVIGENWVWKTTLLKTILKEINSLSGKITINSKIKIWSYWQIANNLNRENNILEELLEPWTSHKDIRYYLGTLWLDDEKINQKIWTLSGGERAKVALSKMLLSEPDMIIMDEPTNHLDIISKESIKKMLQKFEWVTLIVSHDRDFLEWTSNILWVIKNSELKVFHTLERGFDEVFN